MFTVSQLTSLIQSANLIALFHVLAYYCCSNILLQIHCLKAIQLFTHSLGVQNEFLWAIIKCQQSQLPRTLCQSPTSQAVSTHLLMTTLLQSQLLSQIIFFPLATIPLVKLKSFKIHQARLGDLLISRFSHVRSFPFLYKFTQFLKMITKAIESQFILLC